MESRIAQQKSLGWLVGLLGCLAVAGCSDQKAAQQQAKAKPESATRSAQVERPRITMGIFPRRNLATTRKAFLPLAKYLSNKLDADIELAVPNNFAEFWQGVINQEFDLVHFNQYHYIVSHEQVGYRVLVTNEEFGRNRIAGALFVPIRHGISSVEELRGRHIIFGGGRKAMGSYIAPLSILKQHGLKPGTDFHVAFAKTPPSAIVNTAMGLFDAAGSGDVVINLKVVKKRIDPSTMKLLAKSEEFIHLPWAVKKDMPEPMAKRIQTLMAGLQMSDEGKEILKSARVTAFRPAVDSDFDKVRGIVKFALGEEYRPIAGSNDARISRR